MESTVMKAARKRSLPVPWTPQQDELLRRIWASSDRVREHMDGFGAHSWDAVIRRASTLGLGKRPAGPKGQTSSAPVLILKTLAIGNADRFELARVANMTAAAIHKHLLQMKSDGLVHVAAWQRRPKSKIPVPVFAAGAGEDAPKPPRPSTAVRQKQIRARARAARMKQGDVVKRFNPFSTLVQQVAA